MESIEQIRDQLEDIALEEREAYFNQQLPDDETALPSLPLDLGRLRALE